jgi:hypothetical protein
MEPRERADLGLDGIQRLRERARELKELILRAALPEPEPAKAETVQQGHEAAPARYMEIRPRLRDPIGPRRPKKA